MAATADPLGGEAQRWSIVETAASFSGDEDVTVKITHSTDAHTGVSSEVDYSTSLYTADVLATVSSDPLLDDGAPGAGHVPNFFVESSTEGVCMVVGTQIHVFDGGCVRVETTISLDCEPDAVAWSQRGKFLVVADRLGSLHFLHVPTRSILFSQELVQCPPATGSSLSVVAPTFAKVIFRAGATSAASDNEDDDDDGARSDVEAIHELIVVSTGGQGFRFTNVDLSTLQHAIACGDYTSAKSVKAAIGIERFSVAEQHPEGISGACLVAQGCGPDPLESVLCVAGSGRSGVSIWTCGTSRVTLVAGASLPHWQAGIRRVSSSADGRYLAVIDAAMGSLTLLDPTSLVVIAVLASDGEFADVTFLNPESSASDSNSTDGSDHADSRTGAMSLLNRRPLRIALLKRVASPQVRQKGNVPGVAGMALEIRTAVSLDIAYACGVGAKAVFATSHDSRDHAHVAEFRLADSQKGDRIVLKHLRETLPTSRFYRLLHTRRFEDAKMFARNYGLDIELVYQVQVTSMLEAAQGHVRTPGETATQLIAILKNISDEAYVIDFCLEAALPSVEDTRQMLEHARTLCSVDHAAASGSGQAERLASLYAALRRLGTYAIAYSANFEGRHWQEFRAGDMLQQLCSCLSSGKLHAAQAIWGRHKTEDSLASGVRAVIASIPEDILPSAQYTQWLGSEVVCRLASEEDAVFLLSWIEKRARALEAVEGRCWPANALAVIGLAMETQPPYLGDGPLDYSPGHVAMRYMSLCRLEAGTPLANLRTNLEDIQYLMTNHGMRMSLADYGAETPSSIAYVLLDRVAAAELVPSVVDNAVRPYLERHHFPVDKALLHYVVEAMGVAVAEGSVSSAERDSPREAWIVAAIGCMCEVELKAEAVLELMRHTAIPWSEAVDELIRAALAWSEHSRREDIVEQHRLLELRRSCNKHGISRDVNMSDVTQARGLMRRLVARTDVEDAFDDALKVVGAYSHLTELEAHVARVENLALATPLAALAHIKTRVPAELLSAVVGEVIEWVMEGVAGDIQLESDAEERLRFLDAGVALFNFLSSEKDIARTLAPVAVMDSASYGDVSQRLVNISSLQREHSEVVRPDDYAVDDFRVAMAARYVSEFVSAGYGIGDGDNADAHVPEPVDCLRKKSKRRATERSRLFRVGDLLLIPRRNMQLMLAEEMAQAGECEAVLAILAPDVHTAKASFSPHGGVAAAAPTIGGKSGKETQHIIHSLLDAVAREETRLTPDSGERLRNAAMRSVAYCSPNDLADTLELFRSLDVATDLIAHFETGETAPRGNASGLSGLSAVPDWLAGEDAQAYSSKNAPGAPAVDSSARAPFSFTKSGDDFGAWLSESFFSEDGLVLQDSAAIHTAAKYVSASFPDGFSERTPLPHKCRSLAGRGAVASQQNRSAGVQQPSRSPMTALAASGKECVKIAVDNRHTYVALRFACHGLAACTRHLSLALPEGALLAGLAQVGKASGPLIDDLLQSLSRKVLSSRVIDEGLAVGLVTARDDPSMSLDVVDEALASIVPPSPQSADTVAVYHTRRLSIATAGMHVASYFGFSKELSFFATDRLKTEWRRRMSDMGIKVDERRIGDSDGDEARFVPEILRLGGMDLQLALSFCVSHGIAQDVALCAYVEQLLLRPDGRPACNAERVRATSACERVSKEALAVLLFDRLLAKISPYDYETLGFVLTSAARLVTRDDGLAIAKRGLLLLDVLRFYDRRAAPSDWEKAFVPASGGKGSLAPTRAAAPSAATMSRDAGASERNLPSRRLPFHALIECDPWLVLAPEIAPSTVPRLLPLAKALMMTADQFHVRAVHIMSQLPAGERFSFAVGGRPFLLAVADPEIAIATAKFAADSATGREKIEAFETAVEIASRWRDAQKEAGSASGEDKAERTLQRLRDLCTRTATEHALREFGLESVEYLGLITKPQELIARLYLRAPLESATTVQGMEKGEMGKMGGHGGRRSLLALVDEVAMRNGLSADKIRREIVHKWIMHGPEAAADGAQGSAGSAIRRMQFLLGREPREQCVSYMLNVAFLPAANKASEAARVRALSLLFLLAGTSTVATVYKGPAYEVGDRMQQLQYLCTLGELHMGQTVDEFATANKEGLARGLVRNHPADPKAVRMAADLCLDANVRDAQLWTALLQLLSRFGMVSYIRYALQRLATNSEICQVPGLSVLWMSVIHKSIAAFKDVAEDKVESTASDLVSFALQCPLVMELDLRPLCDLLVSRGLTRLALNCALANASVNVTKFVDAARNIVKDVLKGSQAQHTLLLDALAAHDAHSALANELRQSVYDDLDARGLYPALVGGPFFASFVRHLIVAGRIDKLLSATLASGRIDKAAELVTAYHAAHPDIPSAMECRAIGDGLTPLQVTRAYLVSRNMDSALAQLPDEPLAC